MSKYRNIHLTTGDQGECDQWPNVIGGTVNADWPTAQAAGWRKCPQEPTLAEGYSRQHIMLVEGDGEYGQWQVVDRSIAEMEAEAAAADLAANWQRYVLENQYIILCDTLRQALGQAATQEKLGFEELPVMMLTLKAGSKDAYEKLRDAMDMVNAALIRYDVRWWDTARWHAEPVLVNAAQQILGMVN